MDFLNELKGVDTKDRFKLLALSEYLEIVRQDPKVTRNAFQRLYDMIMSYGHEKYSMYGRDIVHYQFFDDPFNTGKSIFGLDWHLMRFIDVLKNASLGYGQERRILLLVGPVGSSKSSIMDLLKIGLEDYSKKDEGRLYSLAWYAKKPEGENDDEAKKIRQALGFLNDFEEEVLCEMHEEPLNILKLLYEDRLVDSDPIAELNKAIKEEDDTKSDAKSCCYPCPKCNDAFTRLLQHYEGDWKKVIENHVRVKRIIISDKRRVCIGTLQPKHEKDQDATELTGDVNYRAVAVYGKESDPRACNLDGEFQKGNRGIFEVIEGLKLDTAFLYDFLEASQAHRIKARKLGHMDIDEVIIAHTNPPDLKKLEKDEMMIAFNDRTTQLPIPYIIRLDDEERIYTRDYNKKTIKDKHIAPHTIEVAAMWSVLTRLKEPKKLTMTLIQKMKLYNGQELPDFSLEVCRELMAEHPGEGGGGISPRYIQDKFANAVVNNSSKCVNPFLVLKELKDGLNLHSSIGDAERKKYLELLDTVEEEFDSIVREEVQEAIVGDENAIQKLCANYIDNVKAYTRGEKIENSFTGREERPDERLMRSVEEKVDVSENQKDDFRSEIMNHIGALSMDGGKFRFDSNEGLHKALRKKLFEDQKDTLKLSSLLETVRDPETQAKINQVEERLIKDSGYCEECARGVMAYVGGLFARDEDADKELELTTQ